MTRPPELIYLDNAASTPVDPTVIEAVTQALVSLPGNPSSAHGAGRDARDAMETARRQVAGLIGARARDLVFTSGATESCNLAIKGIAITRQARGRHIVCAATEHKAVLEPCRELARQGWELSLVMPDTDGCIRSDAVEDALRPDTMLVCVMAVNNVTGVVSDFAAIGALCRKRGIPFLCDATQACGRLPLDVDAAGIDLLALSGHKLHGPKGVGALYVRGRAPRIDISAIIHGGGQERGLRSGTPNVPGIVGLGVAAELASKVLLDGLGELACLRDDLVARLISAHPGSRVLGEKAERAPHIAALLFPGQDARALLARTPGIAAAAGSACSTHGPDPDYVYLSMGLSQEDAASVVRFSIGRFTTRCDVAEGAARVAAQLGNVPAHAPCCTDGRCCG